jgi:hypothetical protein
MNRLIGVLVLVLPSVLSLPYPPVVLAERVRALFELAEPQGGPFPSDHFTVAEPSHNTRLRVALPKPDCAARPSDCEDLDVINELDGFNVQPRLVIPFDGHVAVGTVTSDTVFLVRLGNTLPGGDPGGQVIGVDQVVFDVFTNRLAVNSREPRDQHTRYLLIVTDGVRDLTGAAVEPSPAFLRLRSQNPGAVQIGPYERRPIREVARAEDRGRRGIRHLPVPVRELDDHGLRRHAVERASPDVGRVRDGIRRDHGPT